MSTATLTVHTGTTFDELAGQAAWIDELGLYTSRRWTASQADDRGFETLYLGVRSASGEVLAVAGLHCRRDGDSNSLYNERTLLATDPGPQALAGSRTGYANRLLVHPQADPRERAQILDVLLTALLDQAAQSGASHLAWWYLPAQEAAELAALERFSTAGAPCPPSAQIPVQGPTFAGFVASWPHRRRGMMHRDERRLAQAGCVVRSVPATPSAIERYAPLVVQVQRRHGEDLDVEGAVRYLNRCLGFGLGPDAVATEVTHDGRLVAFCLSIRHAGVLYNRVYGCDYEAGYGRSCEYFGATIYGPVRYALHHGLRAVDVGVTAYPPKTWRGAELRAREVVLLASRPDDLPVLKPDWTFLGEDAAFLPAPGFEVTPC